MLALAGCKCPPDWDGHVIDKHFYPSHTDLVPIYHTTGGKYPFTYVTFIPVFVPDRYEIVVQHDLPDTSFRTWYGAKRKAPLLYYRNDSYDVNVLEYSQWMYGSEFHQSYRCNHGEKNDVASRTSHW